MQQLVKHEATVAICVRDGGKYLQEAIDSAKNQTVLPVEILVIDDGSEDNSADIAGSNGCRVVRQGPIGLAAARNKAFEESIAPWIFFLDADDLMQKYALGNLLSVAKQDGSAIGVNGYRQNFVSPELAQSMELVNEKFLELEKNSMTSGSLWRRDFGRQHIFDEAVTASDVDWIARLREQPHRVAESKEIVLYRRIHGNNLSSTKELKRAYLELAMNNIRQRTSQSD